MRHQMQGSYLIGYRCTKYTVIALISTFCPYYLFSFVPSAWNQAVDNGFLYRQQISNSFGKSSFQLFALKIWGSVPLKFKSVSYNTFGKDCSNAFSRKIKLDDCRSPWVVAYNFIVLVERRFYRQGVIFRLIFPRNRNFPSHHSLAWELTTQGIENSHSCKPILI